MKNEVKMERDMGILHDNLWIPLFLVIYEKKQNFEQCQMELRRTIRGQMHHSWQTLEDKKSGYLVYVPRTFLATINYNIY